MAAVFTDKIFTCISLNENLCILTPISKNFVPKGPIVDKPTVDQLGNGLTHLPLDKMAAISQTIFSCAFS